MKTRHILFVIATLLFITAYIVYTPTSDVVNESRYTNDTYGISFDYPEDFHVDFDGIYQDIGYYKITLKNKIDEDVRIDIEINTPGRGINATEQIFVELQQDGTLSLGNTIRFDRDDGLSSAEGQEVIMSVVYTEEDISYVSIIYFDGEGKDYTEEYRRFLESIVIKEIK